MQWWAWIAIGAILLGSELTLVNAQFYLVFLGISALIVGVLQLAGLVTADWLQPVLDYSTKYAGLEKTAAGPLIWRP